MTAERAAKKPSENIIVKPSVARLFDTFVQRGRILFLGAPCGFGKTSLANTLVGRNLVLRLHADAADFSVPAGTGTWKFLVIDDLQAMQDEDDWQALCELIRANPERRFVLISRGAPPGCLMAFEYAGLMSVLRAEDLLFDRDDTRKLFQTYGVDLSDSELTGVLRESIGYPLALAITARSMTAGRPFTPQLVGQVMREVFFYLESQIYQRFDLPMRRFLLELAPFDEFDLQMAQMVSGDPHAGQMLDWLQRNTSMLRQVGKQQLSFWEQFRSFLLWEMDKSYTDEKRRALFSRGGLYYELREDYARALDCYTTGGDHSKVSELLIRNAELHPGMGHYSEMEKYYRTLPEDEVLASPSLMQGMSMLCALAMDFDGSERWYGELRRFAQRCDRQDAAGRQARSRLAWLDISLPQRRVEELLDTIPAAFRLLQNREVTLPPFSVTSTMPSLLNGAKDFSPWTKQDDLLYKTMRTPLESLMGRDGIGLADCALAESKFEKGEDISARMLLLIQQMNNIRVNGTPDMEFAIGGLLARSQLASGQSDDARRTVKALRQQFTERKLNRFLPNMDAILCRIALFAGDLDTADDWYREKAPRDPMYLNVMRRYQYLTQAMVELADGKPDAALVSLTPLRPYCEQCGRYIGMIHADVLSAIARWRKKDPHWRRDLTRALQTAEQFRYIRTVSMFGAAVLPLLEELDYTGDAKWRKKLMTHTRTQAAYYPNYLQPRLTQREELTATELQILYLICADKSNAEIGQVMDIKLPTVKTHVSHILDKLGVSRRSEAKTAAKKLRLVPDSL